MFFSIHFLALSDWRLAVTDLIVDSLGITASNAISRSAISMSWFVRSKYPFIAPSGVYLLFLVTLVACTFSSGVVAVFFVRARTLDGALGLAPLFNGAAFLGAVVVSGAVVVVVVSGAAVVVSGAAVVVSGTIVSGAAVVVSGAFLAALSSLRRATSRS